MFLFTLKVVITYLVIVTLFLIFWKRFWDLQREKIRDLNKVDMNEVEAPPNLREKLDS